MARSAIVDRQSLTASAGDDATEGNDAAKGHTHSASGRQGLAAYLDAACRAADFVLTTMSRKDGRLYHSYRHGVAKFDAYLDDYACFTNALVTLYEETFDERWIDEAVRLAEVTLTHFKDPEGDGFFFTADDHEELIARQKDVQDSSVPSGNAMAATCLLRLAKLTGRGDFLEAAESSLRLGQGLMENHPSAAGQMLLALEFYLGPTPEIVLIGDPASDDTSAVLHELRTRFLPNRVIACRANHTEGTPHLEPLFAGKQTSATSPTLYVCQDFTCAAPAVGHVEAAAAIAGLK